MIQKTLFDCVPQQDLSCRTCWVAKGFKEIEGKVKVKCFCSLKDFRESGCPSWMDKDESKRFWMPEPLLHESEVLKYRRRRMKENDDVPSESEE